MAQEQQYEIRSMYEEGARNILMREACCSNVCLVSTLGLERAVLIVHECLLETHNLTIEQKSNLIRDKIRECITGKPPSLLPFQIAILSIPLLVDNASEERLVMNWTLRSSSFRGGVPNICRSAWARAYGIGCTKLTELCKEIKVIKRCIHLSLQI